MPEVVPTEVRPHRCENCLLFVILLGVMIILLDMSGSNRDAIEDEDQDSMMFSGTFHLELTSDFLIHKGNVAPRIPPSGTARIQMASQLTAIPDLQSGGVLLRLDTPQREEELLLAGVMFEESDQIMLQAFADPYRFDPYNFGPDTTCRLSGHVDLKSSKTLKPHNRNAVGELRSDCGYKITLDATEVDTEKLASQVFHYAVFENIVSMLQIRFMMMQMQFTDTTECAKKVSLLTIIMMTMTDAYEAFFHLSLGMTSQYLFNSFAIAALFKFVLFSLLEIRYILVLWRARRPEVFSQGWPAISRELSWLYSRFYGVLILGLIAIYNLLPYLKYIVCFLQLYWLPQIVYDIHAGHRNALHPGYIVGMAITRIMMPLYLWGCPNNFFTGDVYPLVPDAPSITMVCALILIQAAQVGVMLTQRKFGARWFVPWMCLPHVYNYYKEVELQDIESGEMAECVICMGPIDGSSGMEHVVTPCNHVFHAECLQKWMDIKMECPTCRKTLPPIT